jgi:crotonobetainyl-CoA:carnitine CoA-transferase CaiB-like acyl-CoA transferase
VIVTTSTPWPPALRDAIEARRPDAVHVSVTPFGLDGPLAGAPANNLTHSAMSGWADICGVEGEPPLQLPPRHFGHLAGVSSFVGAAGAVLRRHATGEGALVDASELEAVIVTVVPWALALHYEGPEGFTAGVHVHHRDRPPFLEALDGKVLAGPGQGPFWTDAMHVLGLPELADDRFSGPVLRRDHLAEIRPRLEERVASMPRWAVFEALSTVRSVSGVVQSTADLLANPHLEDRGYFASTELDGRSLRMPGAPAKLSLTPWRLRNPAPSLSSPEDEPPLSPPVNAPAVATNHTTPASAEAPLAGVRVLTFTQAWSGPLGTELLALLGADVVQIEARRRPDVWRTYSGGYDAAVPEHMVDPARDQHPWNVIGLFNGTNLNKRAITLDMSDPRGAELFWRLVPRFDVVAESFSPHVMPHWGVTYETLREHRPDVIFASLSGYGATGPYAQYGANGGTIEPMSGLSSLHGYEDGPPQNTGGLIPDPVGGMYLASAILAALHHRVRSGEGQYVDLSMMEAMTAQLGDAVLEHSADGHIRGPAGNRHPRVAPHGIYPGSDGRWLSLAAETEEAWAALAAHLGQPELAADARFATAAARKQHEDELDAIVIAWCADQDVAEATRALHTLGCCAAPVARLGSVLEHSHPYLIERGFMAEVEHPESGVDTLAVAPWRFSGRAIPSVRHSPLMGEHSFEVFRDELGLTHAEYDALVEAGVTGDMPPQ